MLLKKSKPYSGRKFVRFLRLYSDMTDLTPCSDCNITWSCGYKGLLLCRKINRYSRKIIYLPKDGNKRNENYLDL